MLTSFSNETFGFGGLTAANLGGATGTLGARGGALMLGDCGARSAALAAIGGTVDDGRGVTGAGGFGGATGAGVVTGGAIDAGLTGLGAAATSGRAAGGIDRPEVAFRGEYENVAADGREAIVAVPASGRYACGKREEADQKRGDGE